ncbi:MAG TPA: GntR family transcriptional regulator [Methylomusa anaerophila]|uniref:Putative HTH-type transcriptional regulator YdfH n=1 Tax=Methylomusa anaerophila TaxID=1930071 RepID=A0A348AGV9_9FIRM|nr:GntR family transcriptional regulator [Methylomusa anaerophila]BBB90307.1 putative HTH-type transcriptional regulator YdfH [Methylomusa anaerophila]HML89347.1 GntR family transcriptional regulator [Methylomusa anaerophila]
MERRLVPIKLDSYKPLREVVAETLREAIISGILQPGERLMEIQMAEDLGVSRTPVREAIRKLELEGFVVMIPRRGTYVAGLSIKDINEVFEIRTALDVLAAGLAVERITEEELEEMERLLVRISDCIEQGDLDKIVEIDSQFHDVLYKASRNDRLVGIISNLREQFTRFRSISINYPGRIQQTLEEHRRLVEAIASRNMDSAQQIAREHMENSEHTLLQDLHERRQI